TLFPRRQVSARYSDDVPLGSYFSGHRATVAHRREAGMSYLVTAPEQVGSAAQNLAGIRSLLAGSAASAAAPTTAVAAAAQDEVSGLVATMFSNFGEEFQTLS